MFNKLYENIKKFIKDNRVLLIIILVIIGLFYIKLPFVVYTPGGTINIADRISVDGKHNKTKGKLQLTYVSMMNGSPFYVLASYIMPNWDLEKKEDITYEDETMQDMIKRDKLYLKQSEDMAIISSFNEAKKEIKIKKIHNQIVYISKRSDTNLEIGDEIISVNGKKIKSLDEFKKIIKKSKYNSKLNLEITRNDKKEKAYAKVKKIDNQKLVGISFLTTVDYETNPKIEIKNKTSESGSSGGLMLSLSIYNQIIDKDIIKGRNVVGTGTIDMDGNVGEIGGVKYKVMGANKDNADIFLVPKENYKEAKKTIEKNNYKMKLVKVETLKDAIKYLEK